MKTECSGDNPSSIKISHSELSQAVTERVLSDARTEGNGIVPPNVVTKLILLAVSPEYAEELIEKAGLELQSTDNS